jgi:mono/diheme cytochrome c family protein
MVRPRLHLAVLAVLATGFLTACGSEEIELPGNPNANVREGAQLFSDKCSGCHTISVAGAQGSAFNVRDRELTDGPNFNTRKEDVDSVLYAIRNGGFSGAIMPENIVVGNEAQKVAEFLAEYSGSDIDVPEAPDNEPGQPGETTAAP